MSGVSTDQLNLSDYYMKWTMLKAQIRLSNQRGHKAMSTGSLLAMMEQIEEKISGGEDV